MPKNEPGKTLLSTRQSFIFHISIGNHEMVKSVAIKEKCLFFIEFLFVFYECLEAFPLQNTYNLL